MHTTHHPNTDSLCTRILSAKVDLDDLAAQEQSWCSGDERAHTTLGSLAVLETLQEIRRSSGAVMYWRDLIAWCDKKKRTAKPELRDMYHDATTEYLTSAAHSFFHQIEPAEQAQILLQSNAYTDPVLYLFHELNRRYGPPEQEEHRMSV